MPLTMHASYLCIEISIRPISDVIIHVIKACTIFCYGFLFTCLVLGSGKLKTDVTQTGGRHLLIATTFIQLRHRYSSGVSYVYLSTQGLLLFLSSNVSYKNLYLLQLYFYFWRGLRAHKYIFS